MKYKTTRKAIVNNHAKEDIISVSYCCLHDLLKFHEPEAYTAGTYGWNFNVYKIHGLIICTGYRNMPGRPANNVKKYNDLAIKISKKWRGTVGEKQRLAKLLKKFCAQA